MFMFMFISSDFFIFNKNNCNLINSWKLARTLLPENFSEHQSFYEIKSELALIDPNKLKYSKSTKLCVFEQRWTMVNVYVIAAAHSQEPYLDCTGTSYHVSTI